MIFKWASAFINYRPIYEGMDFRLVHILMWKGNSLITVSREWFFTKGDKTETRLNADQCSPSFKSQGPRL